MDFNEGVVTIDASVSSQKLADIAREINALAADIKEIVLDTTHGVETSALFALLVSIKKSAPHINIPAFDGKKVDIDTMGAVLIDIRG